ncbi:SDR family NAD(P)-dependent oxidoreductase [Aeropyrum camini]|uniref:SDR family NAD(P)-dependent oxidoreductase n=1 Tax=Aeropyrum camini TaxID=229980 RepID=UPI000786EF12|nr:SDR family oxidoreductase [Aeropyrum camini]
MSSVYALITGGSRGIGRATALRFAREGWSVVVAYRRRADLAEKVVEEAKRLGAPEAYAVGVDVGDPASVSSMSSRVGELVPYLNVVVNAAGVLQLGGVEETSIEEWEETLRVNLTGVFLMTRSLLPLMKRAPWASIVNVASIAGETGNVVAGVAYSASKAGVIGLTKRLAVQLASLGIRVNAVAPSFVETDMTRSFLDTPEKRERIASLHPLRIILKPEDVAEAILFLADPSRSRGITGHVLSINAGRRT